MSVLWEAARAAWRAAQDDRANTARERLAGVLVGFDVTQLTVGHIAVEDTFVLFVFTDGVLHVGVEGRGGEWTVSLVERDGEKWVRQGAPVTSLEDLGRRFPDPPAPTGPSAWDAAGVWVEVGERYTYGGGVFEVVQAHTTQPDWAPDKAKSLWAKVTV